MFSTQDLQSYLLDLKKLLSIETPTNSKWGIYRANRFFIKKSKQFKLPVNFIKYNYNPQSGKTLIITNVTDPLTDSLDVLMMAHLDTVYKKGTFKKTGFKIEGDLLKSPGCIDDKGPALMGLYALQYMDLSKIKFAYFLNNNEETGSKGNKQLIKELSDNAKYCINLEAARTDGSLVDQRFGVLMHTIDFINTEEIQETVNPSSSNTVFEMSNLIQYLKLLHNPNNGIYINFKFLNVDTNAGYIKPKNLSLGLQFRYLGDDNFKKIKEAIDLAITRNRSKTVKIENKEILHERGLYLNEASVEFKKLVENAGKECGAKVAWQRSFGGADSTFIENNNCATLDGFGAIGGNFHTQDEYLDISSLADKIKLLVATISLIAKTQNTSANVKSLENPTLQNVTTTIN